MSPRQTSTEASVEQATLNYSVAQGWDASHHEQVRDFLDVWLRFVRAQLWDSLSAELGLPLRRIGLTTDSCLTVLNVPGLVFYEEVAMLDGIASGAEIAVSGFTVLAGEATGPGKVFPAPMPLLVRVRASQPEGPTRTELLEAAAALHLVLSEPQDVFEWVRDDKP